MAKKDIARYSADDLKALRARGKTATRADAPTREIDENFWKTARVILPEGKISVHLRMDSDVLDWFREQGKGHLTRMNAVLRSYMEAHRGK
jgi:uncharacterized protein (DUF4415 family)